MNERAKEEDRKFQLTKKCLKLVENYVVEQIKERKMHDDVRYRECFI